MEKIENDISMEKPIESYNITMRNWIPKLDDKNINYKTYRLMCYNILCDSLLSVSSGIKEEDLHRKQELKWENRSKKIINEISTYNPDFICIQEYEKEENFCEEIKKMGYNVDF
jgi:mRNA deadenylase 3'-5' endonuclease subunit Ccr4